MKRFFTKFYVFGTLSFLILGSFACTNFDKLTDGTSVYLDTDLLLNPLTVQIIDANMGGILPEDLTVEVVGKDADKVYTLLGEKDLVVNTNKDDEGVGILPIGILRSDEPSMDNPLQFSLIVKGKGFVDGIKTFSLTDGTTPRFETIKLVRIAEPAQAVSVEKELFSAEESGTSAAIELETASNSMQESVSVTVPQGAVLYNESGKKLSGQFKSTLVHYDLHSSEGLSILPGGLYSDDARDANGYSLGSLSFAPVAAISLDMYSGEDQVRTFSQPLDVTFQLNSNIYNPNTGENIKAGDEATVWSFNEKIGQWQYETKATIFNNQGQLAVSYQQTHLSVWLVSFSSSACVFGAQVNINSGIDISDPEHYFYVELIDVGTNVRIANNFFRFYNGETIQMMRVASREVVLKVYDGFTEDCKGELIKQSQPFDLCTGNIVFDLTNELSGDNLFTVNVQVQGTCSADFDNLVIIPTVPILYRACGCESWSMLGVLTSGQGSTSALVKGQCYDFRMAYRDLDRCLTYITVPTEDAQIEVASPVYDFYETIDVVYEDDGHTVNFIYTDIQVPDLACDEYIYHFGVNSGGNDGRDDDN
ncbi:MAG TPA: hypothetical protein PKA00_17450 [Saprospiraceae bacterium]|mgnify:CR=1 FL=1|nr:hypothetical protein [Saprospiraceae bacterium]HMQ84707.1 hypothetical protein [Saprospiraceae bacterium]